MHAESHDDYVIGLIAKSLDETLTPAEQQIVNQAMQNSLALRLVADGLHEFDGLLKQTGMAIPSEGFPARVLARLEAYERHRSRNQWFLTLGVFFLGLLAVVLETVLNYGSLLDGAAQGITLLATVLPVWFNDIFILMQSTGRGPILVYALLVLAVTAVWVRASGGTARMRVTN